MGVVACFIVYTSRGICTLFFLWSRNLQRKIFDLRTQAKIGLNVELEEQKQALQRNLYPHPPTAQVEVKQLVYLLTIYGQSLYTTTNEMTLYKDGRKNLMHYSKILKAPQIISICNIIFIAVIHWGEIRDALIRAAKRGVKVRVLLDAWGSTQVSLKFFDELRVHGGQVAFFSRCSFLISILGSIIAIIGKLS